MTVVVCFASVFLEIGAFVDDEKGVAVVLLAGRAVVLSVVLIVVVSEGLCVVVRFWSTHLSSFEEKTVPLLQQHDPHGILYSQYAFLFQQYVHRFRRDPLFLKHSAGFLRVFVTGIFEKHCQRILDQLQELEETDRDFKTEYQNKPLKACQYKFETLSPRTLILPLSKSFQLSETKSTLYRAKSSQESYLP